MYFNYLLDPEEEDLIDELLLRDGAELLEL